MAQDFVRVTAEPLAMEALLHAIGHRVDGTAGDDSEAGALVVFSGIVRATEGSGTIAHLDYEHYEGMAEREIAALVAEARRRWPIRCVGVVHRVGAVPASEASVIVAVSGGHRAESFEAARFLIDELKKSVPIWKQPGSGARGPGSGA